jgi:hypothetical protein
MNPMVVKKPKEELVRESLFLTYSEEKQEHIRKRFWAYVDIKGEHECWNWKSYLYDKQDGYGAFKYDRATIIRAHRASWVIHYEIPIKKKLTISHSCDNRICCNPGHIFLATQRINMKDAFLKKRVRNSKHGSFMKLTDPDET